MIEVIIGWYLYTIWIKFNANHINKKNLINFYIQIKHPKIRCHIKKNTKTYLSVLKLQKKITKLY